MIIQARLEQTKAADRRSSPRRKISLKSNLHTTGEPIAIHDLSPAGMLIETAVKLPLFDGVEVDLPEVGSTHAVVVWNSGRFYGCEFNEPLPKAAVSAALLRSQPRHTHAKSPAHPIVVVQANGIQAEAPESDDSTSSLDEEKAPLGIRLRVILGSAVLLWAIIIWAGWSLARLIQ